MTPPVPDGPDTELAAIVADLDDLHTEAASVAMRSEGSVTAAAEEVRDDVASIRDRLRAVLARPAAGRDLTGDDVRTAFETWEKSGDGFGEHAGPYVAGLLNSIARPAGPRVGADAAAELEPVLRAEGLTASADAMRARSAVARTDGQPPADEPRRCPMDGEPLIAMNAHRDGVTFYRHADGHGHLDARAELSAAPADDTAAPDQRHPQTVGSLAHAEAMFFRDHARRGYALLRGMARRSSELRRAGQPVRDSQGCES